MPEGFVLAKPGRATISDADLDAALEVACRACDRARGEILPRFRNVAVETKDDGSPVTEADREAERAIRAVIAGRFPTTPSSARSSARAKARARARGASGSSIRSTGRSPSPAAFRSSRPSWPSWSTASPWSV